MIEMPLGELLAIAERDLKKSQAAFAETARLIDPGRTPVEVLKVVESDHPPAEKLLATTQAELDALGRFMTEKRIITIPKAAPARVEETPPFMRATTTASMDIPGPFEKVATEAYYNMTLPDPASAAEKNEFMKMWYLRLDLQRVGARSGQATTCSFSMPARFVGHPQGLRRRPTAKGGRTTASRWSSTKVSTPTILATGWRRSHDALLRDARFSVGINMHTKA